MELDPTIRQVDDIPEEEISDWIKNIASNPDFHDERIPDIVPDEILIPDWVNSEPEIE